MARRHLQPKTVDTWGAKQKEGILQFDHLTNQTMKFRPAGSTAVRHRLENQRRTLIVSTGSGPEGSKPIADG